MSRAGTGVRAAEALLRSACSGPGPEASRAPASRSCTLRRRLRPRRSLFGTLVDCTRAAVDGDLGRPAVVVRLGGASGRPRNARRWHGRPLARAAAGTGGRRRRKLLLGSEERSRRASGVRGAAQAEALHARTPKATGVAGRGTAETPHLTSQARPPPLQRPHRPRHLGSGRRCARRLWAGSRAPADRHVRGACPPLRAQ